MALTVSDFILIYCIPLLVLLGLWLLLSVLLFFLINSRLEFAFKHDVKRKFETKKKLPSGQKQTRLSAMYVARLLLGDSCIQAVLLYRISRFLLNRRMRLVAESVNAISRMLTHTDISPHASIAPGLYIYHGLGIVIGKNSRIGRGATICQGVTIGGGATIGDDVNVWPGAQILRGVTIGDRTDVGANAVVMSDFPADSILFGVPARLAGVKSMDVAGDSSP